MPEDPLSPRLTQGRRRDRVENWPWMLVPERRTRFSGGTTEGRTPWKVSGRSPSRSSPLHSTSSNRLETWPATEDVTPPG